MRIGLIGLGRIGVFHAATLSRHDQVDQLVVTDAVPGMAEAAATTYGATAVADSDALLAGGLDGVVIAPRPRPTSSCCGRRWPPGSHLL